MVFQHFEMKFSKLFILHVGFSVDKKTCLVQFSLKNRALNSRGVLFVPPGYLLEYILNYSDTTRSLRIYSKDEATNFDANIPKNNNFQSFEYKAKLLEGTVAPRAPNTTR